LKYVGGALRRRGNASMYLRTQTTIIMSSAIIVMGKDSRIFVGKNASGAGALPLQRLEGAQNGEERRRGRNRSKVKVEWSRALACVHGRRGGDGATGRRRGRRTSRSSCGQDNAAFSPQQTKKTERERSPARPSHRCVVLAHGDVANGGGRRHRAAVVEVASSRFAVINMKVFLVTAAAVFGLASSQDVEGPPPLSKFAQIFDGFAPEPICTYKAFMFTDIICRLYVPRAKWVFPRP